MALWKNTVKNNGNAACKNKRQHLKKGMASAESLNAKIKLFRAQLHVGVDVMFFLFRLTNINA